MLVCHLLAILMSDLTGVRPISTYGGRGCAKPGLVKWQHAIIYTGRNAPLSTEEMPADGEYGMMASIQVRARSSGERMYPSARINFAKLYTVEHNIKVYDFGDVRERDISRLIAQWDYVMSANLAGITPRDPTEGDIAEHGVLGQFAGVGSKTSDDSASPMKPPRKDVKMDQENEVLSELADISPKLSGDPALSLEASGEREHPIQVMEMVSRGTQTILEPNNPGVSSPAESYDTSAHQSVPKTSSTSPQPSLSGPPPAAKQSSKGPLSLASKVLMSQFHDSGVDMQSVRSRNSGEPGHVLSEPDYDQRIAQTPDLFSVAEEDVPHTSLSDDEDDENSTDITEPDSSSESDATGLGVDGHSESSSPLPPDLNLDERLTMPLEWLTHFQEMEDSITETFADSILIISSSSTAPLKQKDCIQVLRASYTAIENMEKFNYCSGSFNALIVSSRRDCVASLCSFKKACVKEMEDLVESEDFGGIISLLHGWGLRQTCQALENATPGMRVLAAATTAARLLALAIVSYSGAHLQDLSVAADDSDLLVSADLVLRRRSMQCLDAYLHGRQAWVFEEVDPLSNSRNHASLYLSCTIPELNSIWGPVWMTARGQRPRTGSQADEAFEILYYNLGLGFIVPWKVGPIDPEVVENEVMSHYTTDESDLFHGLSSFPADFSASSTKLLIGARPKLVKNDACSLSIDECHQTLWENKCLTHPGSSRRFKERDSQTFTMAVNPPFATVGYQEQYKIREGASFRESLVAAWMNSPEDRNPAIVLHKIGVEVSGCTENARRRTLAYILASETMRTYLGGFALDWSDECKKKYFEAMGSHQGYDFERLYHQRREWRESFGQAVALCLKVLLKTGPVGSEQLSALWCPNPRETWLASLTGRSRWVGILADSADSCAVIILARDCLVFEKSGQNWSAWCKNAAPEEGITQGERVYPVYPSVLETAIRVNGSCAPENLRLSETRWDVKRLAPPDCFELGDSGILKVVRLFHHRRGVMMRWANHGVYDNLSGQFRERLLRQKVLRHSEEVKFCRLKTDPIRVHVTARY
jgi:hypothetical protein